MCICEPSTINGYEYSHRIGQMFNDCVYTPTDYISFNLGLLSLSLYLVSMLPQLWSNFCRKTVEGLSLGFLTIWLVGDIANVSGAILTKQFATVQYTGGMFVVMDIITLLQYAYYAKLYPRLYPHQVSDDSVSIDGEVSERRNLLPKPSRSYKVIAAASFLPTVSRSLPLLLLTHETMNRHTSDRLCNAPIEISEDLEHVGIILAWMSGLLYFFSRIPQVWSNYRRKSAAGLNIWLFILTISANVSYGLSIILRPDRIEWRSSGPFLIGSLGTLIFDACILYQARTYKTNIVELEQE